VGGQRGHRSGDGGADGHDEQDCRCDHDHRWTRLLLHQSSGGDPEKRPRDAAGGRRGRCAEHDCADYETGLGPDRGERGHLAAPVVEVEPGHECDPAGAGEGGGGERGDPPDGERARHFAVHRVSPIVPNDVRPQSRGGEQPLGLGAVRPDEGRRGCG
jgi:hypothetical protein